MPRAGEGRPQTPPRPGRGEGLRAAGGAPPEVLDADHLAPGPGPVHGPPVWIRALARSSPRERPAPAAPTAPAQDPRVPIWLSYDQQRDSGQAPSAGLQ